MSNSSTKGKADDFVSLAAFFCAANGVSVLVCFAAAYMVFRFELHTKVVYRLALYQVLSAMAFSTTEVLEIVFVNLDVNTTTNGQAKPYTSGGCSAVGWFVVYTQWMKLLFTMWVTFHLFSYAVFYKNLKKIEVLYVVTSLLVPAVIACVPLITHSYVLSRSLRCYIAYFEQAERVALWVVPAMVILLASSVAMSVMVITLTLRACSRTRYETLGKGNQFGKALKYIIPLAAYPAIFFVFVIPVVFMDVYETIADEVRSILNSICTSLWSLTSGLTLIIHIYVARRIAKNRKIAMRMQ